MSDSDGVSQFSSTGRNEWSHIHVGDATSLEQNARLSEVQQISLDSFIQNQHLQDVFLLKIDAEGFDYKILKGMLRSLEDKIVTAVIFELDADSLHAVTEFLTQLDFEVFIMGETDMIPVHGPYWHFVYESVGRNSLSFGNVFAIWRQHRLKMRILQMYNEHVQLT